MSRVQLHGRGLIFVFAAMLAASCAESSWNIDGLETGTSEQAIVNGTLESGWDGVGALTLTYAGYGYTGSFCSGTLIAPQWVLTAAHCIAEFDGNPDGVRFYVGTDARPSGYSGLPATGTLYQAGMLLDYPDYDPDSNYGDIALVWLSEPATGIPTYAYNTADIGFMQNSASAFYVGYGVSNGATEDGGGVKRSVTIDVTWVSAGSYSSDQTSAGVCFGDSGGPGLYNFGSNDWRVIGVNSTVGGYGSDPCLGGDSNQTRVDAFHTWITSVISSTAPDCNDSPSICVCPEACLGQGWCDNSVCRTDTCADIYTCMGECADDQSCAMNCYNNGSTQGQTELDGMLQCFDTYCANAPNDDAYQTCIEQNCQTEIDTCFPVVTGDATCEEAYDCMLECADDDATCQQDCYNTGTALAQEQINAMWDCWDTECGTLEGDPWGDCIYENCGTEMDTCWPPTNCALTGGDCDAGTACYPTASGATDCFTSDGLALGAACDPAIADRLVCADGLICLAETQTTGSCYAFCHVPGDCEVGETCYIFTGSDLGYCDLEATCTDADSDGYCEENDCNDTNPAINPDATESCADNVDNNCDGFVNEGCSGCTDGDSDGYCDDVDCNDANPLVWPGAPENCADSIDNDCDTYADGADIIDCPSGCPDADGDGFPNGQCGGTDCNDSQSAWFPGADEICTDTYDNNCNGTVNEGCTTTNPNPPIPYTPRQVEESGCSATGGTPWLPLMGLVLLLVRRRG